MKVVIDTNLLIDGVNDDYSYANRIIDLVLQNRIEAFANMATLRENKLLARRKINDEEYLQKVEQFFEVVNIAPNVEERLNVVSDREDNKLVESAVAVGAEYLITSDKHLLVLEEYDGIKMVTPVQFWNLFLDQTDDSWGEWIKNFIQS